MPSKRRTKKFRLNIGQLISIILLAMLIISTLAFLIIVLM